MTRILHVISAPASGGAETYVRDLAKAQKAMGSAPHIAFLETAADLGRDPIFEAEYLTDLDTIGIPYFFIGHDCRFNIPKGLWRVAQYCRRRDITHYHAHLLYGLIFGATLSIPRFFTEHNHRVRGPLIIRRALNLFVEAYIGISEGCAAALEHVVGRPITVIVNGVDASRVVHNTRRGRISGPWRLLCVGRIVPQKNYSLLIEAVACLEGRLVDDFTVEIAGDGAPGAIALLEGQAVAAGIDHRVNFLGNRLDVAELMASSDLLLMSSAWEGLPIVLLEAVTAHLPFVATSVGGCGEIAEATGAGVVVPPDDADALAVAVHEVLTQHSKRNAMRDAAARSAAFFSIAHSARAHLDLYEETLKPLAACQLEKARSF